MALNEGKTQLVVQDIFVETKRCLEIRSIRYAHAVCKSALLRVACSVPALLGAIGYDGTKAVQAPEVIEKLYGTATLIPAIILLCMLLLLAFGYRLSKHALEKLQADLQKAREE